MKIGWQGSITNNEDETVQLGENLSNFLELGDVFAFEGELASGKTTFTKGVLKGLGYNKSVTSPTFTLVNEYDSRIPIIHIDCYREDEVERWIHIGIADYFSNQNVVIIEWPERIRPLLPQNTIRINFKHQGQDEREILLL